MGECSLYFKQDGPMPHKRDHVNLFEATIKCLIEFSISVNVKPCMIIKQTFRIIFCII